MTLRERASLATLLRPLGERIDLRAAALGGLAGGAAFLAVMPLEMRISGRRLDDLVLLGYPITRDVASARRLGVAIHAVNSVGLAVLYAAVAHDRLPGHPAVRGAAFATVENSVLYPLTAFEDRHPAVQDGALDRYWSITSYLATAGRHLAYGAVLGWAYERSRRRSTT